MIESFSISFSHSIPPMYFHLLLPFKFMASFIYVCMCVWIIYMYEQTHI